MSTVVGPPDVRQAAARTREQGSASLATVDVRLRVGGALDDFLTTHLKRLRVVGDELGDLDGVVRTFVMCGGKRLRPLFAYWGAVAAGGTDADALVRAAASLELLHAFALIHDDLMDASDLRRGRPAAHRQLESMHADAGWEGDPARFGRSVAILVGDLLMVLSEQMLATSGLAPDALGRARSVYATMRLELMAGQYLDIASQARRVTSVERALRVARYKSGAYTVEAPLHLGAAVAGAPAEVFGAYTAFALPLGEAFQLRDDVLGVFGNQAVTGKPSGEDLREGKRTALVALARERASQKQRACLSRWLGAAHLDEQGLAELRQVIVATGALETVETMIADRTVRSLAVIDAAPLADGGRAALRDLAVAATVRSC